MSAPSPLPPEMLTQLALAWQQIENFFTSLGLPAPPRPWFIPELPAAFPASFAGFREQLIQGKTTTRKRDGATAYDFQHFPLLDITPDIFGTYTVTWGYTNKVDGSQTHVATGIVNTFNIKAVGANRVELRDTRATPPRDPARGESIGYGDPDQIFDGVWHRFQSAITATVKSPSGATVTVTGALDETFKSVAGALSASYAGLRTALIMA